MLNKEIAVFSDVTPCNIVHVYRHYWQTGHQYLQGRTLLNINGTRRCHIPKVSNSHSHDESLHSHKDIKCKCLWSLIRVWLKFDIHPTCFHVDWKKDGIFAHSHDLQFETLLERRTKRANRILWNIKPDITGNRNIKHQLIVS